MKKINKLFLTVLLLLPGFVDASENTDNVLRTISPDLQSAVLKMSKPTNEIDADFTINGYFSKYLSNDNYSVSASCSSPEYTNCTVSIQSNDYQTSYNSQTLQWEVISGEKQDYNLNVTYEAPTSYNSVIDNYIGNFSDFESTHHYYQISDLSLINYYLYSNNIYDNLIKYIDEIREITEGANISFSLNTKAGTAGDEYMYGIAKGPMTVFYNGYAYGSKNTGIYMNHIIYIPEDTNDTINDYISAAKKRVDEYYGDGKVEITYGGLISSLTDAEDPLKPVVSDGNYYNVKINNHTYKFYIIKGSDADLKIPSYSAKNLETNVIVKSNDTTVPLDSDVNASVLNKDLSEKLKTNNYKVYDIYLFSNSKNARINKLDNGVFEVYLPISDNLKDKDLVVYYEKDDGNFETYDVTIEGNYAKFTTNHFSEYILSELSTSSSDTVNPQTGDNILIFMILSFISLASIIICLKIKNTNHA